MTLGTIVQLEIIGFNGTFERDGRCEVTGNRLYQGGTVTVLFFSDQKIICK